jgi:hypothetical protein
MDEGTLYLLTAYKEGKRVGMEVSETIESLRAESYKESTLADEVKYWKCEEIKYKETKAE